MLSCHFILVLTLVAVSASVTATAQAQGQQQQRDPANLPLNAFLPPSLRSLQVTSWQNSSQPVINPQPWDPKSTSCQPLLDAIASARPGSALRDLGTPDGPTSVTLASPLYSLSGCNPSDPTRQVLVGASENLASSDQAEPMSVLVHWHGTGSSPSEIQRTTYLASLRNTLVLTPASALGPFRFEWHLVQGDAMPDVWLTDDLVACVAQSPRVNRARIYTSGMSAGGLHATYLSLLRPHYLAAAVSFSGGVSHLPLPAQNLSVPTGTPGDHPYAQLAPRLTTILATAGGPRDQVIIQFPVTTDRMQRLTWSLFSALSQTAPGVAKPLVVRCDHDRGHRIWMGPEAAAPFLMAPARVWRVGGGGEGSDPLDGVQATSDAGTCKWVKDAGEAGVNADEIKAAVEARAKEQGVGVGEMAGKQVATVGDKKGSGSDSSAVAGADGRFAWALMGGAVMGLALLV